MRRVATSLAVLAGVALLPAPAFAQEAPHIWAVSGVYGLERTECTGESADITAQVATALCPALDQDHRQIIGQRFVSLMSQTFPGWEARFAEHMPASATPRARLASTLIVTLHLSRAAIWTVSKPGSVDAYLPITLTLNLTNAATGEVVFSRSRTDISQGAFPANTADTEVAAQFPAKLDATLTALIAEAAAGWKPYEQQATVVSVVSLGTNGKGWVIDHGRDRGFRSGDSIGADGTILYSGPNYAVVQSALAGYQSGEKLGRMAAAPVQMLARPSVLVSFESLPPRFSPAYLTTLVEERLGNGGAFAPMPLNAAFQNIRVAALGEAQSAGPNSRSLPDYVANVQVVMLPSAKIPSEIPNVYLDRHEAHAFIALVDRTGRIVGSSHGVGIITDKVAAGIKFNGGQRSDTIVRNALIDAVNQLDSFKPQALHVALSASGGDTVLHDPAGAVPIGAEFAVLRDVGHLSGIEGNVRVPIGWIRTTQATGGEVSAQNADISDFKVRDGDVIAIEAGGPALSSRQPYAQCVDQAGALQNKTVGDIQVASWPASSMAILAQHFSGPVHISTLADRLQGYAGEFAGWDRYAPARALQPAQCIVPVQAIKPNGKGFDLILGYLVMKDGQKTASSGMSATVTPATLPSGVAEADAASLLQSDLIHHSFDVAQKAASGLKPAL